MENKKNSSGLFSGSKKAALLLLSLKKEEAAKVLSHLDDKMIEEVVVEMSKIRSVSKVEKESILAEFQFEISRISGELVGGIEKAREILTYSRLGESKAEEIIGKISKKDIEKDFDFFNSVDHIVLSSLLAHEAPQTIAVTLSFLQPKVAALVLKNFPEDLQAKIAMKLAITSKTHPDAISEIAKTLKKKYEARDKSELSEAGGAQSLANILNHMDKNLEDKILRDLTENSPELAGQVREKLYSFEDIFNLDNKEMRILINRIGNNELFALALRGAGDELKKHFFGAMSQNRAYDIVEEMESKGRVTLREIQEARNSILFTARNLEEENLIIIKKGKEEYI
ncbi:MAG: flagellar motor switch protein FliG [Leptospiraceae bacterium]|nr:flagellar motor switch protein FliG [Leptospiraceae bacterium]MCK6379692.1 flagellar motor switch protein FliG [Leptospiraceae bacterium]NUM41490.1 flagellar motor switch protein FliG [Leptospiraceae bacterium]